MTVAEYIIQKVKERLEYFSGINGKNEKPKEDKSSSFDDEDNKKSFAEKILTLTDTVPLVVTDSINEKKLSPKFLNNNQKSIENFIEQNQIKIKQKKQKTRSKKY